MLQNVKANGPSLKGLRVYVREKEIGNDGLISLKDIWKEPKTEQSFRITYQQAQDPAILSSSGFNLPRVWVVPEKDYNPEFPESLYTHQPGAFELRAQAVVLAEHYDEGTTLHVLDVLNGGPDFALEPVLSPEAERSLRQFGKLEELCRDKQITIPPVVMVCGGRYPMEHHRDMCRSLGFRREEDAERIEGDINKLQAQMNQLLDQKHQAEKEAKEFRDVQDVIDENLPLWEEPGIDI